MKKFVESKAFQGFIIGVIILAGVLVGLETYPSIMERWGHVLLFLDMVVITVFVIEIALKIAAEGRKPWNYFKDSWNVFDFTIVAIYFLPFGAAYVAVFRLVRILRVFRLITALPKLQIIVGSILRSIPSMGYVGLLLALHFYIYGVMGTFLFAQNDPLHFGNLQTSMLSLFRAVTLEDWTDMMYINMYGCANYGYELSHIPCDNSQAMPITAAIYFVSFIITGAMVFINLFIGVIIGGMDEMKDELKKDIQVIKKSSGAETHEELLVIEKQIDLLNQNMVQLKEQIKTLREKKH